MKSYRDLNIYKDAHRLAIIVHKLSLLLPKFEMYEEGSQIRRSSKAISTAIVEGYGRKNIKQIFLDFSLMPNLSVTKLWNILIFYLKRNL